MQINDYLKEKKRTVTILLLLAGFMVLMACVSLFVGQYGLSLSETIQCLLGKRGEVEAQNIAQIIINIRLPRTISAIVIGGMLAVSGLTYQSVFRNNLCSQDIIGVSTGACVGAAMGIVLGFSAIYIQLTAFIMGVICIVAVFLLSSQIRLEKTLSLILSGILVGGVMSSLLALIKYTANPETHLKEIVYWTMGDISSISFKQMEIISIPTIVCVSILMMKSWQLNYFSFPDSEARSIGFNIKHTRFIFIACATILVASAVSVSGNIGWIGLVIPQLVRLLVGSNSRYTAPLSFLMGSAFLLTVDMINRIISTAELPVSIISGLLGLPIFVICWFINAKKQKGGLL